MPQEEKFRNDKLFVVFTALLLRKKINRLVYLAFCDILKQSYRHSQPKELIEIWINEINLFLPTDNIFKHDVFLETFLSIEPFLSADPIPLNDANFSFDIIRRRIKETNSDFVTGCFRHAKGVFNFSHYRPPSQPNERKHRV